MPSAPKPLVLVILDGFGHSDSPDFNAMTAGNLKRLPNGNHLNGNCLNSS